MIDRPSPSRLVLLPGMGVDGTMYAGPWRTLVNTHFVDWPPYDGERTLGQLAERVIEFHRISPADEIGGTSLGGMVALEIARRLGQRRVLLLSSAMAPLEVQPWLRILSPLSPIAPFGLALAVMRRLPGPLLRLLRASGRMLQNSDPAFLRAMCTAVVRWEGCPAPPDGVVRIHGDRDWMIRCPADAHLVRGAGHLVVITHPRECVRLTEEYWFGSPQYPLAAAL